jgi:hypothetical protein
MLVTYTAKLLHHTVRLMITRPNVLRLFQIFHHIYRCHCSQLLRTRFKSAFANINDISSFLRSKKTMLTLQESAAVINLLQVKPLQCPENLLAQKNQQEPIHQESRIKIASSIVKISDFNSGIEFINKH